MLIGVVPAWDGGGWLAPVEDDGRLMTAPVRCADAAALAREVARRERVDSPRWLWPSTAAVYPALLAAGVRVGRCHDLELVETLLLGYGGRWGEPRALAAADARARGLPVPADPRARQRDTQPALFAAAGEVAEPERSLEVVARVFADQRVRMGATEHPERMRLLAAAESAGALAASELGYDGLPWSTAKHEALLAGLLGPRPQAGDLPAKLHELAAQVGAAFGGAKVNPDAPADVLRAFGRAGIQVPSTRSWVLKAIDHPAVAPLMAYKELSRLFAANGWAWQDAWVSGGRMRPEYVAGGVVSGRWATRGGGALQLPKVVRQAVVADPGWMFVVADAAALEPRVLAALSDDRRMAEAAAAGDLYSALAADAFDGDRARAKVAMLGALYGQTSGEGGRLQHVLRRQFPHAVAAVEEAARQGERGELVRSRLGRTCPAFGTGAAAPEEWDGTEGGDDQKRRLAWGRFTRNFLVQATAAEWALILLAGLRRRLDPHDVDGPQLVFFQHDEVVVHCPRGDVERVRGALAESAEEARTLLFGRTPVRFPLDVSVVECYADAD